VIGLILTLATFVVFLALAAVMVGAGVAVIAWRGIVARARVRSRC
jgi:hypothetical protein